MGFQRGLTRGDKAATPSRVGSIRIHAKLDMALALPGEASLPRIEKPLVQKYFPTFGRNTRLHGGRGGGTGDGLEDGIGLQLTSRN